MIDSNFYHVVAWHRAFLDVGSQMPCWRIHRLLAAVRRTIREHGARVEELHTRYFVEYASARRPLTGARE